MTTPRILRLPAVIELTGLKRSTLLKKVAKGQFPRQIKLGERASGFIASEVHDWIQARIDASRGPVGSAVGVVVR